MELKLSYRSTVLITIALLFGGSKVTAKAQKTALTKQSAEQLGLSIVKRKLFGFNQLNLKLTPILEKNIHQLSISMYSGNEKILTESVVKRVERPELSRIYSYRYNPKIISKVAVAITYPSSKTYEVVYELAK